MQIMLDDSWPQAVRNARLDQIRIQTRAIQDRRKVEEELYHLLSVVGKGHMHLVTVYPYLLVADNDCGYCIEQGVTTLSKNVSSHQHNFQGLLQDACLGLQYIHSRSFALTNLCAQNIVVCRESNGQLVGKIADLTASLKEDTYTTVGRIASSITSPAHTAPELSTGHKNTAVKVNCSCDVWSVGMIVWVFFEAGLPWQVANENTDLKYWKYAMWLEKTDPTLQVDPPKVFQRFPNSVIVLLENTVRPNEKERWTLSQVIEYLMQTQLSEYSSNEAQ